MFVLRAAAFVVRLLFNVPLLEFPLPLFVLRSLELRSLAFRLFALFAFELRPELFELLLLLLLLLLFVFLFRAFLLAFSLFELSSAGFEAVDSTFALLFSVAGLSSGMTASPLSPSFAEARLTTTATVWPTFIISPACGD